MKPFFCRSPWAHTVVPPPQATNAIIGFLKCLVQPASNTTGAGSGLNLVISKQQETAEKEARQRQGFCMLLKILLSSHTGCSTSTPYPMLSLLLGDVPASAPHILWTGKDMGEGQGGRCSGEERGGLFCPIPLLSPQPLPLCSPFPFPVQGLGGAASSAGEGRGSEMDTPTPPLPEKTAS